jgi:hypothetical protein
MTYPFMPEGLIPLTVGEPRLGNSAITEYVNVSEAEMVWIDCFATVAAAAAIVCTPLKAYAAAGTGSAVLGFNCPIWAGTAVAGAALTLTQQTDAANYTTAATAGVHRVIFQIDPAALGKEASTPSLGDYKYMSCTVTGLVADYVACTFWVKPRYANDDPASTRWIV